MFRSRSLRILSALPIALLALACSDGEGEVSDNTSPQSLKVAPSASGAETTPPDAGYRHGAHQRGRQGPAPLIGAALRHLELTGEQRNSLSKLSTSLRPPSADERPPHSELRAVFARAFQTGTLDRPAIDQVTAAMKQEHQARQAQRISALNELHQTLTPEQRTSLVERLQQRGKGGKARWAQKPGDAQPDQAQPDQAQPNQAQPDGTKPDGTKPRKFGHGKFGHGKFGHGKFGHGKFGGAPGQAPLGMLHGVELSESQREALAKAVGTPDREMRERSHEARRTQKAELLTAFATPKFDATKFISGSNDRGAQHLERRIKFVEALLSILNPEQREQLASKLEKGPMPRQRAERHWHEGKAWGKDAGQGTTD